MSYLPLNTKQEVKYSNDVFHKEYWKIPPTMRKQAAQCILDATTKYNIPCSPVVKVYANGINKQANYTQIVQREVSTDKQLYQTLANRMLQKGEDIIKLAEVMEVIERKNNLANPGPLTEFLDKNAFENSSVVLHGQEYPIAMLEATPPEIYWRTFGYEIWEKIKQLGFRVMETLPKPDLEIFCKRLKIYHEGK